MNFEWIFCGFMEIPERNKIRKKAGCAWALEFLIWLLHIHIINYEKLLELKAKRKPHETKNK